jgi:hypothetical protein
VILTLFTLKMAKNLLGRYEHCFIFEATEEHHQHPSFDVIYVSNYFFTLFLLRGPWRV